MGKKDPIQIQHLITDLRTQLFLLEEREARLSKESDREWTMYMLAGFVAAGLGGWFYFKTFDLPWFIDLVVVIVGGYVSLFGALYMTGKGNLESRWHKVCKTRQDAEAIQQKIDRLERKLSDLE